MKKILFLGGLSSGGSEHQMVIIARLMKKEGYDVTYLCSDKSNFFGKDLDEAGVPIIRIKENKIASLFKLTIPRTILFVHRIIKKNKYDTVISFLGEWNFYNCLTAKWRNSRHRAITGIRNNREEVFLWRREKFYYWFERYAYIKVSNSEAAKNKFAHYYPELASKLTTIYNVVELPEIGSSYTCKKDGKINIIVPASYRAVKNPMRLLEAVSIMSIEERQCLKIDWFGDVKSGKAMYEQMEQFINEHLLKDVITLHDATTDIANLMNEADVVGLFSTSEGLPNSICEGMMLGKPVIMTKVSDYDVLVNNSNGFLCDANSTLSIKEALCSVAKLSEHQLIELGNSSKRKAQTLFSEKTIIEHWKQII